MIKTLSLVAMNYIDIFILVILMWFGYKGFRKGLVFELVSIIALALGIYGGLKFSDTTAEFLASYLDSEYLEIISFTVTFLVILLLVFAAGKIVEKIINLVALKLVNKLLGAFFAIVKIGLVLAVLITIIESYDQKLEFIPKEVKSESLMYEPLLNVANTVLPEIEKNNLFKELKSTSLGETE
ncbi:MAG: CvpA family protein [Flavobacteriales bacterium]|nr:CvpA family protein [Flavobacteriales bacterium]MDG1174436.1 CvpA family protein [Flavobacteriales bacterium]